MIIVNRHGGDANGVGGYITGSYNGNPFGVSFDETKFVEMKRLEEAANNAATVEELRSIVEEFEPLTKESYKELVETKCEWVYVNRHTNKFYLRLPNGKKSSKPMPKAIVDRILESVDKKIDILPLVKYWIRVLRNPNYTDAKAALFAWYINQKFTNQQFATELQNKGLSSEVAHGMATTFQTPITQEGLIGTYKVVNEVDWKFELDEDDQPVQKSRYKKSIDDVTGLITYTKPEHAEDFLFCPAVMGQGGDAFFCGDKEGHVIRVGLAHFLDSWDKVDTRDTVSCKPGLHCGNQDYIRSYQSPGTVTLNIFVDPMDIGAVVQDNTGALRVKRFFAHSIFGGTNRGIYHSSDYAKLTDEEYRNMLAEAITATGELHEKAESDLEEAKALID